MRLPGPLAMLALLAACAPPPSLDLSAMRKIDLTHAFNPGTLYWPTSPGGFELEQLSYGPTPGGWFYSAYAFRAPEHGGTHLDAPIHFSATGQTVDQVPLDQLILPAVVIDISARAAEDRDALLTVEDLERFETANGRLAAGVLVLLRTGWDQYWGDRRAYFGDATPGDASKLHFPGFGVEVAKVLIEDRQVRGLGVDTPSIDYGPSTEFEVHRLLAAGNGIALENLAGLGQLPPTGTWVIALPMKIEKGSGGPARVVALVR